jgi:integrase
MDEPISAAALIVKARTYLLDAQYTPLTLKKFERVWQVLERYMAERQLPAFTPKVGISFLADQYGLIITDRQGPADRLNQDRLRAINTLAEVHAGVPVTVRRAHGPKPFSGPWSRIMEAFVEAERHAGRSARTMNSHLIYLSRLAQFLDVEGITDPSALAPSILIKFVSQTAEHYSLSTLYCTSCLLRVFLRYLRTMDYVDRDLAAFVPAVASVKRARIPSAYSEDDIERLLKAVDRASPKGRRDYAILLLACRLGLRASDICRLTFENFHWETNTLVLNQQKTGEPLTLPLLTDVGTAVIEYLKHGRPSIPSPIMFVRLSAPIGPLSPPTLHSVVNQYLARAGITVPKGKKRGPHALRHSLASALLRQETPLPIISAVLGHRNSTTTSTYLTIDFTQLRTLALPVPPVRAGATEGGL